MDTITKESPTTTVLEEENIGLFCEICLEFSGERVHVYGYCTDCREYLCKHCSEYHCKPKPSRNHNLVYKSDIPELEDGANSCVVQGFVCPKPCETHPDMPVLQYCDFHKKQICSLCASIIHMSCETEDIMKTETRFLSNRKLERTFAVLDKVLATSGKNMKTAKDLSLQNDQQMATALDSVQKLVTTLHNQMDEAMKNLVLKLKKYHKENQSLITSMSDTNKDAFRKVNELKKQLQRFADEKQYSELYWSVQRATVVTSELEGKVNNTDIDSKYRSYTCRVDKCLHHLIENPQPFVLVNVVNGQDQYPQDTEAITPVEYVEGRIANYYEEVLIRSSGSGNDSVYTFMSNQQKT